MKFSFMEVKELQARIIELMDAWDKKRNTVPNEQLTFNHLVEEVGELAREYVNKEHRKEKYNEKELENAIGDAFIQLVRLAHLRGLDIEEVVLKIIENDKKILKS